MITYYDVLGVDVDAEFEDIRRAYHRKAQLLHPDRHATAAEPVQREAESAMKTLNQAWDTLKDSDSRQQYDVNHRLVDEDGAPADDVPGWSGRRPVAADECELCGSGPAAPVVLRQETGKIIWRTRRRVEGTFCRDCGLALFRSTQNRTLITGWWGILSFFVNMGSVIGNAAAWGKLRTLTAPRRDPAVVSYLESPLDPGRSVFRRAGIWVAAVVLLIVGSAIADGASKQDGYSSTPSYSTSSGGSSSTWPEEHKSVLRSGAMRAGLSYADADCTVRYMTTRYSLSDINSETAFGEAWRQAVYYCS
jgi:hypothetical protein